MVLHLLMVHEIVDSFKCSIKSRNVEKNVLLLLHYMLKMMMSQTVSGHYVVNLWVSFSVSLSHSLCIFTVYVFLVFIFFVADY